MDLASARPAGAAALRFYLDEGDAIQYALIGNTQTTPTQAPAVVLPPISGPGVFDEFFTENLRPVFLPTTGTPKCRWM